MSVTFEGPIQTLDILLDQAGHRSDKEPFELNCP